MGILKLLSVSGLGFLNWIFYSTILTDWFSQFNMTTQVSIAAFTTLLLVVLVR